jgi:hypothetical protein
MKDIFLNLKNQIFLGMYFYHRIIFGFVILLVYPAGRNPDNHYIEWTGCA